MFDGVWWQEGDFCHASDNIKVIDKDKILIS